MCSMCSIVEWECGITCQIVTGMPKTWVDFGAFGGVVAKIAFDEAKVEDVSDLLGLVAPQTGVAAAFLKLHSGDTAHAGNEPVPVAPFEHPLYITSTKPESGSGCVCDEMMMK
jgi:hypothetical protein